MISTLASARHGAVLRHLCRHELRTHRRLLTAWALVMAAHPLLAALPWFGVNGPKAAMLPMLLPLTRVLLMAVIVAGMVQDDSPVDDRAFWRTRPVPAPLLAASKALIALGAFVLAPTAVVAALAWYFGIPLAHWPPLLAQVIITETAVVGLVLMVATRTRTLATLLLAAVFATGSFVLLINAIERYRRLPWVIERGLMADPQLAFSGDLGVIAVATAGLFFIGYRGHTRRHTFAAGVFGGALAIIGVWFVPLLRAERAEAPAFTVELTGTEVRAERLTRDGKQIGLVAHPKLTGLRATDRVEMFLLHGQLQTPSGVRDARRDSEPRSVVPDAGRPQAPLLAVLDPDTFAAIAGQRVRFAGTLNVHIARKAAVATTTLRPGGTVATDSMRFTITDLDSDEFSARRAVARGLQVRLLLPWARSQPIPQFQLRDPDSGCLRLTSPYSEAPYHPGVLLPTLSRPFNAVRAVVSIPPDGCALDYGRTQLQLVQEQRYEVVPHDASLEFTVPTAVEPLRTPHWDR